MTQFIDSISSSSSRDDLSGGATATFGVHSSGGAKVSFGKSSDLSFFNMFQNLQASPVLQGSVIINQSVDIQEESTSLMEPSVIKTEHSKHVEKASLSEGDIDLKDNTSEEVIWIKYAFGPEESKQMDQWLTHLVQQPQGLPVPWFFQMAQQFNVTSGNGQGTSFSGQLMDAMTDAFQSGKSIRIALENQTDLILRFSHGKVSAEFMTENPQLQATLQETVAQLRRHLESKELPVGDIVYRDEHSSENFLEYDSSSSDEKLSGSESGLESDLEQGEEEFS